MNIFDKRPLSLILCIMLGGFVFFSFTIPAYKIAIPVIAIAIFVLSFFILNKEKSKIILMRLGALVLLLASIFSYLYFDVYFPIYKRYDEEAEIIATVEDINTTTVPIEVTLVTTSVNSNDEVGFKILLYTDVDTIKNVSQGAEIRIIAKLEGYEFSESYLKSLEISATITHVSEIELISVNNFNNTYNPQKYRNELAKEIIINTDAKTGGLLSALLLGEGDYLNAQTSLDFKRTGTSHILALSGMHLAILTLTISKLFSLLRFNKKSRKIIEIIFVILYMTLTRFSPSIVRSGLMLIISALLFLLSQKSDSISSLFIAVTLICIFDPCTVFDISLWLSMLATFGILILSEFNNQGRTGDSTESKLKKSCRNIIFIFLASIFAMSTTILLTVTSFETLTPLGLIITPLISPVISLFMNIGLIFILFTNILPLGPIIQFLGEIICDIIGYASSFNGIFTSADFLIVKIIVIAFTILTFSFFIFKIKRKKTVILIMCALLTVNYATAIISTAQIKKATALEYSASDKHEYVYISSESENAIIDACSPSAYSVVNSIGELRNKKLTEIDNYVFTTYSQNLSEAIECLVSNIHAEVIHVPLPSTNSERDLYNEISELSSKYRVTINYYDISEMIFLGDMTYFPIYRSTDDEKLAFTVKANDEFYSYLSAGMFETNTKAVAFSLIEGCNTLILGSHGSNKYVHEFKYNLEGVSRLVISTECFKIASNVTETNISLKIYSDPASLALIR